MDKIKARIPGRYGYANAHDMYAYLGVTRLPDEGMPVRLIHMVEVYVKPLVRKTNKRTSVHRVIAICTCGQHVPAGRLHQHKCKGGR